MKVFITCDISGETKVDKVMDIISDAGYKQFFSKKNYGESVTGVCIILMCRAPYLNFKQRIRFSKKEMTLYIDIMLDYKEFINVDQSVRNKTVAEKLITEVPLVIAKYKFKDFDLSRFEADWKEFMDVIK